METLSLTRAFAVILAVFTSVQFWSAPSAIASDDAEFDAAVAEEMELSDDWVSYEPSAQELQDQEWYAAEDVADESEDETAGGKKKAPYLVSYADQKDFQLVDFSGGIPISARKGLRKILRQIHGGSDIVLKVGRGFGGSVPAHNWFIRALRNRCSEKRGSECKVMAVFTADCYSACTHWPLRADYAVALPASSFHFHRITLGWPKNWVIETKRGMIRRYARMGANRQWLSDNIEFLVSDQRHLARISKVQELEMGLIDAQVASYQDFLKLMKLPVH